MVAMEAVRLDFTLGDLNSLECCSGDVGNAFLNECTKEKIYIIDGPEFDPALSSRVLIIVKFLYSPRKSATRFREHLTDNHRN